MGGSRRSPALRSIGSLPKQEAQAHTHQRVPAECDRDPRAHDRRGQVAQPRIGDAVGEQQVRREAVLCRRPVSLVGTEPVREEHPAIDHGGIAQPFEMAPEGRRAVTIEEQAEHGRRAASGP